MIEARYAAPVFPIVRLGALATLIQYGTSQRSVEEPVGVPVLRIPNLQADGWDLTDLKYTDLSAKELAAYRLQAGDILFNRTNGSRDLVGKCEVFDLDGDWAFASYLIRLRLDRSHALPEFVSAFLNTYWGRRQVEHVSRQILMSNINIEEIRALRIPLPDTATQRALLTILAAARAECDAKLADADRLLGGIDAYLLDQLGLAPPRTHDAGRPFAVSLRDLRSGGKMFPDYYHPDRTRTLAALRATGAHVELQQVVSFVREQRDVRPGDFYVGLANVAPNTGELVEAVEDVAGKVRLFQPGDVLFARLRPYLNKVWVADRAGVCSPEFHVMRLKKAGAIRSPEYLAAVLRGSPTIAQTRHMMTGNTHPRLSDEDVVRLLVPLGTPAIQAAVTAEVERRRADARLLRLRAKRAWETGRQDFETALLGPEVPTGPASRSGNA